MKSATAPHRIRLFEPGDSESGFRCGKHSLDDYFHRHAAKNDALGIGRTFVLVVDPDDRRIPSVVGYFTLAMASASDSEVRERIGPGTPRYPLPVALIGRLAVDERARGHRFGEALLLEALDRVREASSLLGCVGVVVDALDEDAERFYSAYDFEPISERAYPRRMFLAISTIREALGSSNETR